MPIFWHTATKLALPVTQRLSRLDPAMPDTTQFSRRERQIMDALYRLENASVREVREHRRRTQLLSRQDSDAEAGR